MVIALGIIRVYDSNIRIESTLERNLMENEKQSNHWHEETSRRYLDYGNYFVPQREQQVRSMVDLLMGLPHSSLVLEQLVWLKQAGFKAIGVHYFQAGRALFSGWKKDKRGKKRGK